MVTCLDFKKTIIKKRWPKEGWRCLAGPCGHQDDVRTSNVQCSVCALPGCDRTKNHPSNIHSPRESSHCQVWEPEGILKIFLWRLGFSRFHIPKFIDALPRCNPFRKANTLTSSWMCLVNYQSFRDLTDVGFNKSNFIPNNTPNKNEYGSYPIVIDPNPLEEGSIDEGMSLQPPRRRPPTLSRTGIQVVFIV